MNIHNVLLPDPFNRTWNDVWLQRSKQMVEDLLNRMKENGPDKYRPKKISITVAPPTPKPTEPPKPVYPDEDFGGNWTPPGLFIRCMEYLHVTYSMPWWAVIAIVTITIKWMLFPLIMVMKKPPKSHPTATQTPSITSTLGIWRFMVNDIRVLCKYGVLLITEILVSFSGAYALVRLIHLPVDSMKQGGLLWFRDLTAPDQCYVLPLIISTLLALDVELDFRKAHTTTVGIQRYILRAKPLIVLPVTTLCPAAVQYYWVLWVIMTHVQSRFLRPPRVIYCTDAPTCPLVRTCPEASTAPDDSEGNIFSTVVRERNEEYELV